MLKLTKEQCDKIMETVAFQLMWAKDTASDSIILSSELGTLFYTMLEEKKKQATCKYCHEDSEGYVSANGAFFLSLNVHDGWLLHAGKSKCKPRPIKYCPMCGRKLLSFKEEVLQK